MKKQILAVITIAILVYNLIGCATAISQYNFRNPGPQYLNDTCEMLKYDKTPIVFSGAYADIHNFMLFPFTASGEGGLAALPFYPLFLVIGAVDLPFSLAADTVILPYTVPYSHSLNCEEKTRIAKEDEKRRINTLVPVDFNGTVVDSVTGEPIEGAVVLAIGYGMGYTSNVNMVTQGVSDKEGNVRIIGKFPMLYQPPAVMVYKRGYFAQSSWNHYCCDVLEKFKWPNGYVFKMKKWDPRFSHKVHYEFIYNKAAQAKNEGLPLLMNNIQWEKESHPEGVYP